MKIDKIRNHLLDINQHRPTENRKNNIDIKKDNSIKIEISNSAKELSQKISDAQDEKFSEKVEAIRLSILNNTYKTSSENIAEKILKIIEEQKGSDK